FNTKKKGDVVATAFGDEVHQADLQEVRRERLAARTFLIRAREASYYNWAAELGEIAKGTQLTLPVREFVAAFAAAYPTRFASNVDAAKYRAATDPQRFQALMRDARPESEDRRALNATMAIMVHDMMGRGTDPVLPDRGFDPETDDGALNFLLLIKKADQLGIKYSDKAIVDLVARETGGRLTKQDNGQIEAEMRKGGQFGSFTGDWLLQAVGNEFRARSALAAVQGQTASDELKAITNQQLQAFGGEGQDRARSSARLGGVTPYEFFEFYKDQCSEHTFSAIEVPASAFVAKVEGTPTIKERVELFNKYRNELPDPASDKPGFKDPRKAAVSFVALDANAKRITDAQPKVAAANLFLALTAAAQTPPGGAIPALMQAVHPELAATMPVREAVASRIEQNRRPYTVTDQFLLIPRDTSVYRPEPIAALVAGFAGYPSVAAAPVPYVLATRYMEVEELKHRIPFDVQAWLMPFNPVPTNAFGFPAYALAHQPKAPPEGLYSATIVAEQKKKDRRQLFEADVEQLQNKLRELTDDPDRFAAMFGQKKEDKASKEKAAKGQADARKYLADWLAERGLTAEGTNVPQGAMDLSKDPALKPLNDLAFPEADGTNSFAQMVFAVDNFSRMVGRQMPDNPRMSVFQPEWFPRKPMGDDLDKPNHLFWLTKDVPATQYASLKAANEALAQQDLASFNGILFRFDPDRMTDRVDKAWRLEKARALAKAEADKLVEKVREIGKRAAANPGGVEKEMRDLVAAQNYRVVTLDGMAKLKFDHMATQAQLNYGPPKIDKLKVQFPSADFADKLLEVRNDGPGAVTAVADAPRTHYYVACLVSSTPKTVEQFRDVFAKTNAVVAANPLYEGHALQAEQLEAQRSVVARLRAEAGVSMDALKKEEGVFE
ncbi:MAG TPA: hypothetical protein VM597_02640, partial [Gemmataceae bacterium]|nr:hypothetical protein [Gemmataceae bacterium]